MNAQRVWGRGVAAIAAAAAFAALAALPARAEAAPQLIPVPESVTYQEGTLSLGSIDLVGADVADADAVRVVKGLLADAGATVTERTAAEGATSGATALYLTEADDACAARDAAAANLQLADASKLKAEGYVLGVDPAAKTVVLTGRDGDGTFYAAQTLAQLIEGANLPATRIADEPHLPVRGTIEGFYARGQEDWSWDDRMEQVRFYGQTKMNTYIYAPKEDPYHRDEWRDPYPADQMAKMRALIQEAARNKVDFVFALSPGNSIDLESDADFQALTDKCQAMYDEGVRHFAIFFDDIENKDGVGQAKLLNRFNAAFIKKQPEACTLATVPTEYDSNAMSLGDTLKKYTKDFSATIDDDIEVLWTGSSVVPDSIKVSDAAFVTDVYGDRAGIWWNYPTNDYQLDKLAMGPIYGIDKQVFDSIDYFVMNPMGRASLSRVTLATGADISWNTAAYDDEASLKASCALCYPELADSVYALAINSSQVFGSSFSCGRPDAPEMRAHADAVLKAVASSDDPANDPSVAALRADMQSLIDASAALTGGDFDAISAFTAKLGQVGRAGNRAIDLLLAKAAGNTAEVDAITAELTGTLSQLKSGKLVSDRCLVYFVEDALAYTTAPTAGFEVASSLVQKGAEVTLRNTSSVSAVSYEWTFPGAQTLHSNEAEPTVVYTKPGRYDVTLTVRNRFGEDSVTKKAAIYVVDSMPETMENLALGKQATANKATNDAEGAPKAVDGVVLGSKWCAEGNGGHTLTVDLGAVYTLSSFRIQHAEAGGEGMSANTRAFTISVSQDGTKYTEVVNVDDNTKAISTHAITPTAGRYVRLDVKQSVQPGTQWPATRIFEFEAYGITGDVSDLPAYVAPNDEKLAAALEDAGKLDGGSYTADSWAAFAAARDAARALMERGDKTQDEVDAALAALEQARTALVEAESGTPLIPLEPSTPVDPEKPENPAPGTGGPEGAKPDNTGTKPQRPGTKTRGGLPATGDATTLAAAAVGVAAVAALGAAVAVRTRSSR